MTLHVTRMDVIHDEGERVDECEDEKSVSDPSVKNLKFLMRNARKESDPVCFARSRAFASSVFSSPRLREILDVQYERHACQGHPA